ncbi:MAG TPA: hypothetical protein VK154_01090 [Chitinophagales bacterium]|nr:hypothetical protein [Chitinophagales bacterium]
MLQFNSFLLFILLINLSSCYDDKWETIRGNGIDEQAKSIEEVIFFENEFNGLVGGYTFIEDNHAQKNHPNLATIPTLFITKDGGLNWTEVKFGTLRNQAVINAVIYQDTLLCQTDSLVFFSKNNGQDLAIIEDTVARQDIIKRLAKPNRYTLQGRDFYFDGKKYAITESFQNNLALVIICSDSKTLTDYYFVSYDEGKNYSFLQKIFGDNRERFLLGDKFLYCYHFPLGLKRLKLR